MRTKERMLGKVMCVVEGVEKMKQRDVLYYRQWKVKVLTC